MISEDEAIIFLEKVLAIPKSWRRILESDKLEFLRIYMNHHATRIPFQNVSLAAVDTSKRCPPDESTIIAQGMSGKGGCCIHLNYFTKIVLKALGLDAYAIQGTHFGALVAGTHCMIVVKIGEQELYLIEVGGAFPILEPVPMHKLPFCILTAGGFPYEFRRTSDGAIGRFQIGGGLFSGEYINKDEALRTSWDLIPRTFSEFDYPMKETFTNPETSVLLRNPMMCRYFYRDEYQCLFLDSENVDEAVLPDVSIQQRTENPLDFIFVFKRAVIIGDAFSRKIVRHYDSYNAMIPDIQKYFPTLEQHEIVQAFKNFDVHEVVPSPYDTIL